MGAIIRDESEKILILRRKQNDFLGGNWEIPGGKVEGSETLTEAVQREVLEKTGLYMTRIIRYVDCFDYLDQNSARCRQFNFFVEVVSFTPIHLTEHDAYDWSSLDESDNYLISTSIKTSINEVLRK